jgi:DNA-binding transcriptional MerR regulator
VGEPAQTNYLFSVDMLRTASQIAELTHANRDQVKDWAWEYKNWLSPEANPPKGSVRHFTDEDALKMVFIVDRWVAGANSEEIAEMLEQEEHWEDRFREQLYMHTPLFQEVPDGLDESWRHGCLYTPSFFTPLELARNYRWCADELLEMALKQDATLDLRSPVLFAYRHALELYLKILGRVDDQTHSLARCLGAVERRAHHKMRDPHRAWILELDAMDPGGTSFRYNVDDAPDGLGDELWIDFNHVKFAMNKLLGDLDMAILNDRGIWKGNPRV